jgi:hypothetical protein
MPVPRLFEAAVDVREQWAHVVASLLALTGPETRAALLAELVGESVDGAERAQVAERRPFPGTPPVVADVVVRSGSSWGVAIAGDLGFGTDRTEGLVAVHDALAGAVERATVVAVTPDRRMPDDVREAAEGRDIRHRSWLRVRDWVQERPERGRAQGVDAVLLREAEYFLTPRVAELYRLEGLAPLVRPELRAAFAGLFFDLQDLAPQPTILNPGDDRAVITSPRTGDPVVTLTVGGGGDPVLAIAGETALTLSTPEDYRDGRSRVQAAARAALPPRR